MSLREVWDVRRKQVSTILIQSLDFFLSKTSIYNWKKKYINIFDDIFSKNVAQKKFKYLQGSVSVYIKKKKNQIKKT